MTQNNTQIETRDAHTNDEAWMLEKINQKNLPIDSFSPREFLVSVNAKTEERMGFGRTEYIRNVDDTEYVEINSFIILDAADQEFGYILLNDLADKVLENDKNQIFAFPSEHKDIFKEVGFEVVDSEKLPQVMQERYNNLQDNHNQDTVAMTAEARNVNYTQEEEETQFNKPDSVDNEEIENIKEDLNIDDSANTKYST